MVEKVVEFKAKLQIEPLRYVCVFVSTQIRLHKGRIAESVILFVAFVAWRGCCELSGRKDASDISAPRRRLPITGHVWKVEVISVGIVVPWN